MYSAFKGIGECGVTPPTLQPQGYLCSYGFLQMTTNPKTGLSQQSMLIRCIHPGK